MNKDLKVNENETSLPVIPSGGKSNDILSQGMVNSVPRIKINSKQFDIVVSGDVLHTLQEINITIVDAAVIMRKFYLADFTGSENKAPDCFSMDGRRPHESVKNPICKSCLTCPNAQFGTSKTGKGTKCSQFRRLVLCAIDKDGNYSLYRFSVPGKSLKPLSKYGKFLEFHGVDYWEVVTKIDCEPKETFAVLRFTRTSDNDDENTKKIIEKAKNDPLVQEILYEPLGASQDYEESEELEETQVEKPKPKKASSIDPKKYSQDLDKLTKDME